MHVCGCTLSQVAELAGSLGSSREQYVPDGLPGADPRLSTMCRQRAIEIVPSGKPLRCRWYDVPQHVAPEPGGALRFRAVEGDLDLLDRRHGPP
jgi:hypothetical protein